MTNSGRRQIECDGGKSIAAKLRIAKDGGHVVGMFRASAPIIWADEICSYALPLGWARGQHDKGMRPAKSP